MAITLACSCGAQFEVEPERGADQAACPVCGRLVDIVGGSAPTAAATRPERARAWGFWATIAFSLVVLIVLVLLQGLVAATVALVEWGPRPRGSYEEILAAVGANGLCLSIATLISNPCCVALVCLFAWIRRGQSVREYLGLRTPSRRAVGKWLLILAALICCSDLLSLLLGRPIVPEIMIRVYETSYSPLLLYLALFVMAPVFEEVFIRGFLFRGIRYSRLGTPGAILITALVWAGLHLEYDIHDMSTIFAMGIALGFARLMTGSTTVTIVMHAFANIVATGELLIKVHLLS